MTKLREGDTFGRFTGKLVYGGRGLFLDAKVYDEVIEDVSHKIVAERGLRVRMGRLWVNTGNHLGSWIQD